jgi:hypothetical protein
MQHHPLLIEAIVNLRPGAQVNVMTNDAGDEDTITVHDDTVLPSEAEVLAECQRMLAANEMFSNYKFNRKEAYGNIGDQLDQIYWDAINGTSVWKDGITSVKNTFPK